MLTLRKFAERSGFTTRFFSEEKGSEEIMVENKATDISVWGMKKYGEWTVEVSWPSASLPRPSADSAKIFADTLGIAVKVAKKFEEWD